MVEVKVINLSKHRLPEYATSFSAGMDLIANLEKDIEIGSLNRALIPTGLYIEIPTGYEAQVRPRSGFALKQGIGVLNSPGTIDCDYRGEIKVILVNLSDEPVVIHDGDRIAQIVFNPVERISWVLVDNLGSSERGTGGFGHTGKI